MSPNHPCEKLWPLEFPRASVIQFEVSRYIMSLNWTSMWKVMTTWILESFHCRISSVSIYYVPELDFRVKSYDHFELLECFRCSIGSFSIYYPPQSEFWVKHYDHMNFSRAFVVQFRASRYIMRLNQTFECKVITILISRELPLFNFERLDILCAGIGLPSEMLWPFEFLERFRYSIWVSRCIMSLN